MGRPRKPTALKVLAGNPGKRPLPKNEPKPKPVTPPCPSGLTAFGRKEWVRLAEMLGRLNVMTESDTEALEMLVRVWCRWVDAEELVRKQGLIVVGPNGVAYRNPALKIADDCIKHLQKSLSDFGMTPSSRTKIQTIDKGDTEDEQEQFFKTTG